MGHHSKKISFNYELDGKVLHYSCDGIYKLEKSMETNNKLAPRIDSKVITPKLKGRIFVNEPQTVSELIEAIKNNAPTFKDNLRHYSKNDYNRIGIYEFEDVFPFLEDVNKDKDFVKYYAGQPVSMNNAKYHVFKASRKCVCCGLEGEFLALEQCKCKDEESLYHFNMYGYVNGEEVLFTKDHILPKSLGGPNDVSNYQTMCTQCNAEKGNDDNISMKSLRRKVLLKRKRAAAYNYATQHMGQDS